jgi:hypothetical protein
MPLKKSEGAGNGFGRAALVIHRTGSWEINWKRLLLELL